MRPIAAKSVPRLLRNDQKQRHINMCLLLWEKATRTQLLPLFRFVSKFENETEGTSFWNSVWHPKGIACGTWQH
jgi:hypothetical protein